MARKQNREELKSFVTHDAPEEGTVSLAVSAAGYHADTATISKTMLSHFHHSPFNYWMYYVADVMPPPKIKAGLLGSICHDVLLCGVPLSQIAVTYPAECLKSNGAINAAKAGEWLATLQPGQYAVKEQAYQQIEALLYVVRDHEVVQLVEQASAREEPIYWTDVASGMACRARPDFYHELDDEVVCYDLKFTDQFFDFWRTARSFKYWMQDGHYSRGLSQITRKPVRFVFWAIESTPPFRVARYEYDQQSRENAWEEVGQTLCRVAECHKSGDWSDRVTRETNMLYFQPYESSPELDWS